MKSAVASYQCASLDLDESTEMIGDAIDAKNLFVDLGMLILEGRTPEKSIKGRSEGDHCPVFLGRSTHMCDSSAAKCKQMEAVRAYIWFLCRNDIPMSVEVLLYPDCCYTKDVEIEIGAAAESGSSPTSGSCIQPSQPDHLLIEQWIVQLLPKRFPEGQCFGNILLQAVRSFLHFSQLSAWLSSSKGKMYNNIVYRVCAPGDSFSTDFVSKPDIHTFPVLNISKSSSVRVSIASLPRQKTIPMTKCIKDAHRTLQHAQPKTETPLYQEVGGSDLYPVEHQSLRRRQRSIEDLKFELQQRNPTWRQKHSSGEDNSTSSSSEDDQAEKIKQKKALCSAKLEVVLPEVYEQQGAVPKVKTPPKKHQANLEEDKAKYLPGWGFPQDTPVSLYKCERQELVSPQKINRQLFSMPISTKSSWKDIQAAETKIVKMPPSASLVDDQISPPESHRQFFDVPTPTKLDQDVTVTNVNTSSLSEHCGDHRQYFDSPTPTKLDQNVTVSNVNTTSLSEHHFDHRPLQPQLQSQSQLISLPIPTKCSRDNSPKDESRLNRTPPRTSEADYSSRGMEALDKHINRGQFSDRLSSFASHGFNKDSLVPNYYDTSFSSMQSINQQLSSLSLVECSTDTYAETSSGCTDDDNDGGDGENEDDIDWQFNLDDRTPRLRKSSERTLSTEEEDNGICFSAKSSDDLQFEDASDVCERDEEFWDTCSTLTDEGMMTHDNYCEISDDDSFVSCRGSFSNSPCLASFTPRQQLEDQLRKKLKHRDVDASHVIRPSSGPSSPAKHASMAQRSSPKHDNQSPVRTSSNQSPVRTSANQSPVKTSSKFSSSKDSPTHTRPSPNSSPCHNRTRGFSLDSQDFQADIPAPFHRPVPSPTEPPVCGPSAFTPSFSKSKSLLRTVIGKENVPQAKQVERAVLSEVNTRSPPRSPDRTKFRRSFDSSNTYVFHPRTGLPINSSPAPLRKAKTTNDCAALLKPGGTLKSSPSCNDLENAHTPLSQSTRVLSTSAPASTSCLLGNFEESVLNGRLEPLGTIDGFTAEIGASGSFCPKHIELPVETFFYSVSDDDAPSSYFGYVNLESIGRRGYHIPKCGTVQVTLFNPNKTVVKIFVMRYDLSDMPPNCQTFARQRIFYMPSNADLHDDVIKELRYLMHLRFQSSKSGKIYLHTDARMIFARHTPDLESSLGTYELRSFTETPLNPRFSPKR